MNAERRLTVLLVGVAALVALGGSIYLAANGRDYSLFLAVCTGGLGILAPSPLSKTAVPDR